MSASWKTPGWKPILGGFVGGALVFWTPSISLHALSPDYGTLGEPLILGLMLPVLVFGAVIAPG